MTLDRAALLATAQLYLCTDARTSRGDFAEFVDLAYAAGVDIVQLRDKTLSAAAELDLLTQLAEIADTHGKLFAVNDRADFAAAVHAPVLHLGQEDLPVPLARHIVGPDVLIGRSTHSPEQFNVAMGDDGVDYVCAGPIWPTPTKPGRPSTGVELILHAAASAGALARAKPWFAIGGIDTETVPQVVAAGATRVVVVRAVTAAADPAAAVARLRAAVSGLA